jgi:hypothetical protein
MMSVHLSTLQQLWKEYFVPEIESESTRCPYSWEAVAAMKNDINDMKEELAKDKAGGLKIGQFVGEVLLQFDPLPDADMLTFAANFLLVPDERPSAKDLIACKTAVAIATGTEAVYTDAELKLICEALLEKSSDYDEPLSPPQQPNPKVVKDLLKVVTLALPGRLPKAQVPKARAFISYQRLRQSDLVIRIGKEIGKLPNLTTIPRNDQECIYQMAQFAWKSKIFKVLTKEQRAKINEARETLAPHFLRRLCIIVQNFFLRIRDLFATTRGLSEEDHRLVTDWLEELEDTLWPKNMTEEEMKRFVQSLTEEDAMPLRSCIIASFQPKLEAKPVKAILARAKKTFAETVQNEGEKASPALKALSRHIEAMMDELVENIAKERAMLEAARPLTQRL